MCTHVCAHASVHKLVHECGSHMCLIKITGTEGSIADDKKTPQECNESNPGLWCINTVGTNGGLTYQTGAAT